MHPLTAPSFAAWPAALASPEDLRTRPPAPAHGLDLEFLPLGATGGLDMKGGTSSAESTTTTDTASSTAGGFHGSFVNNFAARGATLDAASAAGDPGLVQAGGSGLLWLAAAAGGVALWLALRKR